MQKQVEVIGSKSQEVIAEQSQRALFKEKVDKKKTFMYVAFGKD